MSYRVDCGRIARFRQSTSNRSEETLFYSSHGRQELRGGAYPGITATKGTAVLRAMTRAHPDDALHDVVTVCPN